MATQNLSAQAPESNTPRHDPAIVSYTTKDGCHVDLDNLRHNLEVIAEDIDVAEALAREAGDIELAEALNAVFYDVDGLIPAVEVIAGPQNRDSMVRWNHDSKE